MGIVFQKSAKLVLDAKAKRRIDLKKDKVAKGKLAPSTRRKLMQRRQAEFDALVEEASIWMYAMILPTEVIAHSDAGIKKNLDDTIRELTINLLGSKIDHDKVNRVCGRIARNILVTELANFEEGTQNYRYPPTAPEEQIRDMLDDRHMTARPLSLIHKECPNFQRLYPNARTWREVREALVELELELPEGGPVSIEWFDDSQMNYTYRELQVPGACQLTADEVNQVSVVLQSEDPEKVFKLDVDLLNSDQIIVRRDVGTEADLPYYIASIYTDSNYMNLHSNFYNNPDIRESLRDFLIVPEETDLQLETSKVQTLLHEIIHSASILRAADHSFRYIPGEVDDLEYFIPIPDAASLAAQTAQGYNEVKAYRLELCLALVRRDELNNTNKAEDNADSWATYFLLRMLILVYPEFDFLSALNTPDPFDLPIRLVQRRKTPLHHCSLFEPLRSREPLTSDDHGPIRSNLSVYQPYKDKWSGFFGHKPPRTTAQLLEVLKQYAHRQEKKSQKNARHKVKQRAKQKLALQARREAERVRKEEAEKAAETAAQEARAERVRRLNWVLRKQREKRKGRFGI